MNIRAAKQQAQFAIEQLKQLQHSFVNSTFSESTGILFGISNKVLPCMDILQADSDAEGRLLAEELNALFASSLDLIESVRSTRTQPEGRNLKLMLIEQSKINNAVKLASFLKKHDSGFIAIGGVEALSHALRYAATFGCDLNIPVLIKSGANSLKAGNESGLPIHGAIKKLHVKCVKSLLESLDTEGGYYCDVEQLLRLSQNNDALAMLAEMDFFKLSDEHKKSYIDIHGLIIKHLSSPFQSHLDAATNEKRLAHLVRARKQLDTIMQQRESKDECLSSVSRSSSSAVMAELKKNEISRANSSGSVNISSALISNSQPIQAEPVSNSPSAAIFVPQYRYTQDEMKEIMHKLSVLTDKKEWRIKNNSEHNLVIALGVKDEPQGLAWASALTATGIMQVDFIKNSEADLKKYLGMPKFSIKVSNINLLKLRELNSIEGFATLADQVVQHCPPGGPRIG